MHKKLNLKRSALAVSIAMLSIQSTWAQEAGKDKAVERVVITGSNIKRSEIETASPVQTISRKEIKQSGATTVKELLDNISATSTTSLSDKGGSNSFAGGASGVDLRDLGKSSTLILLNSRRVATYGFADGAQESFVNIDTIPTEIVERIDILKDGASAIYGSDAVAGVINIITRKDFQGVSLSAAVNGSLLNSHLDKNRSASVTFGFGDLNSQGFNVYGHLEAYHRTPYTSRDVINSVEPWFTKYVNPNFGVRSTYSYPGNFVGFYPDDYADPDLAGTQIATPRPGCAPANLQGGLCRFDQWARVEASPTSDRVNGFFSARKTLGDNLSLISELHLSQTKTHYHSTPPIKQPGNSSTWYDRINQRILTFVEPDLPVGHPDNPYSFDIPLRYRYADDVEMFKNTIDAKQFRFMVGLEGQHFGWDWNSAVGYMASETKSVERGSKHFVNYVNAVTSGEYRFGGKNSPELLARMFPQIGSEGKSTEAFFDLRASRELMDLPGGKLAMAVGVEARHETFKMKSSDNILKAEIVGFGGTDIEGTRNLGAVFTELVAPVSKKFEASFALRADKTSTAPASMVPKLGLRYNAADFLTLRGTYAHGFRSPNLPETGKGGVSAFLNNLDDPKRCPTATKIYNELIKGNEIDRSDALSARDSGCAASAATLIVPNPNLDPEKSRSYTFGLVLEPIKNVSILIDYFNIERRNEIRTQDINQVLSVEDRNPGTVQRLAISDNDRKWAARVKELTGKDIQFTIGEISGLTQSYQNQNKSRRSGIDLEVDTNWNVTGVGKLRVGLEATYMLDYRNWDSLENGYTENLLGNYTHPRLRATGKVSLESGKFTWGMRVNHTSGTNLLDDKYDISNRISDCADRDIPAEDCRVRADTTVDLSMIYRGIKNTTISANLKNVFNRQYPLDVRTNENAPARGRSYRVNLEYKF